MDERESNQARKVLGRGARPETTYHNRRQQHHRRIGPDRGDFRAFNAGLEETEEKEGQQARSQQVFHSASGLEARLSWQELQWIRVPVLGIRSYHRRGALEGTRQELSHLSRQARRSQLWSF